MAVIPEDGTEHQLSKDGAAVLVCAPQHCAGQENISVAAVLVFVEQRSEQDTAQPPDNGEGAVEHTAAAHQLPQHCPAPNSFGDIPQERTDEEQRGQLVKAASLGKPLRLDLWNQIGELKQVVVPYTLSLLNIITAGKLDLYKIWKNQHISMALSDFIYDLMKQVNKFIIEKSPVSHYIEWAKKEDCWQLVKSSVWSYNLNDIKDDCIDAMNPPKRNHKTDTEDAQMIRKHQESIIRSIPFSLWKKIEEWGRETGYLHSFTASIASDIAYKIKNDRKLLDTDITRGYSIYETVWQYNPEMLEEADALAIKDKEAAEKQKIVPPISESTEITLELIQQMVDWDRRRRVLDDWKWKVMKDVVDGKKELTDRMKYAFYLNFQTLKKRGFPN